MRQRFKKIVVVAGARPNFMKVAPLMRAFQEAKGPKPSITLVHTGQHYDYRMSRIFFQELDIPRPDIYLGAGSGSHAQQTARVMMAFEKTLVKIKPDLVMVVGDVNSTLACALTAHKMGIAVAHIEAGLRSRDWAMPEESNRVLTDHLSDLLFTPSRDADENLIKEGIDRLKIRFVGNVMIDSLAYHLEDARKRRVLTRLGLVTGGTARPYALVTLHRPANVDDKRTLKGILRALQTIGREMPVVYPVHPRTARNIEVFGLEKYFKNFRNPKVIIGTDGLYAIEPLGYLDFVKMEMHARCVLTDSGGIQEETTWLGVPCLTLRENTERPVTVEQGTNQIVGTKSTDILKAWGKIQSNQGKRKSQKKCRIQYWDGKAAGRIVIEILKQ